jgi:membrane protease YdiL (CAAX protease family)
VSDEALQGTLLAQLTWLGIAVVGALVRGGSPRENLGLVPSRIGVVHVGVLVLGFLCLSAGADLALRALAVREAGTLQQLDQMVREEGSPAWMLLLVLAVLPGFGEELLFRGFALRAVQGVLGAAGAVFLAAVLFGLAHGNLVHGGAALVLGLYLGVVAVLAGSVWPAIACHLVNNTAGVLSVELGIGVPTTWAHPAGLLVLLAAAGGALAWAARNKKPSSRGEPAPEGNPLQPPDGSAD